MTAPSDQAPILIVEDDKKTASLIALYLEREGYRTLVAYDGETGAGTGGGAQTHVRGARPDVPRVDGWEVCRRLRKASDVPILILTARDEEVDRVVGAHPRRRRLRGQAVQPPGIGCAGEGDFTTGAKPAVHGNRARIEPRGSCPGPGETESNAVTDNGSS